MYITGTPTGTHVHTKNHHFGFHWCNYTVTTFIFFQEVERQYKQQVAEGGASDELKFSYAMYLIKSGFKNDIRKGIGLMESKFPCVCALVQLWQCMHVHACACYTNHAV